MTVTTERPELQVTRARMPDPAVREHPGKNRSGFLPLAVGLVLLLGCVGGGIWFAVGGALVTGIALAIVGGLAGLLVLAGLTMVAPGEATVLQFFGRCPGTVRTPGLRWVNPFTTRRKISTRIRNHESDVLKVNDREGSPMLSAEVAVRVESVGVRIIESRLAHLAYALEVAGAMLQRRQAGAVVSARERIVEGAVGIVDMALARLAEKDIIELDEERKAAMVSNLLVVLCGDRATQPIVNAGSLHH